ncbi:esterase-like activity of phytase family protein [Sphingomonas gilva]|uniref:Esterase-like activity of phytase family protein n=1 Tax=Sphingomonas gilva TaxID=2305907 RepID=A0A396RRW4_9SPHN|nr:esterase-like activity of phytase family protein [Sphingomonas gilva]RHW18786.1 esterase-like activity of phytase family protein [Sphingomonas gilva]
MRRVLLLLLFLMLLGPGWSRTERLDLLHAGPAAIRAERVALDPDDPARRRLGRLTYLGGVSLDSPDPAFGGFSALHVAGDRFVMLSDGGGVARFRMDGAGRVSDAHFADLPGGPGGSWDKRDRDAEALAVDPATGRIWVAFERWNAIWRYAPGFARAEGQVRPAEMAGWSFNGGPESLARRADGSFVVLSESHFAADGSGSSGRVFLGDPVAGARSYGFRLRAPKGWLASDAAELPDGRLLVLLRRFALAERGFANKLLLVERGAIRPGAVVRGRVIATLRRPLIHDNFEGLAISEEQGRTIVWLLSDDNQLFLQRTLLLKFAFDE